MCKKFKEWKELGYPLYPISCNLSRHQISRPDLIYILCDIVDEYGVDHSLIDFEITESADFADVQYLIKVLKDLKAEGFKDIHGRFWNRILQYGTSEGYAAGYNQDRQELY